MCCEGSTHDMACVLRPCSALAQPVQQTPAELKLRNTDHEQICCNAHNADPESGNHVLHSSGSHSFTDCYVTSLRTMVKKKNNVVGCVYNLCIVYCVCLPPPTLLPPSGGISSPPPSETLTVCPPSRKGSRRTCSGNTTVPRNDLLDLMLDLLLLLV